MNETSKSSPRGGKRGCLCKNGTYSKKCCNGDLHEQGVGALVSQGVSNVVNTNEVRVIENNNG
jgi:hypothetical protein